MTFIIYTLREFIDKWRTDVACMLTDQWYDNILKEMAEEYLEELRQVAKEKTKI